MVDNRELREEPLKDTLVGPDDLPTTPEIAAYGVHMYEAIATELPVAMRSDFLENRRIRRCMVGLTPEAAFYWEDPTIDHDPQDYFTREEFDEISAVLEKTGSDFLMMPAQLPSGKEKVHMINLQAARRVMLAHPNYFPAEAGQDTRLWLSQNPSLWVDDPSNKENVIRYGLLSGIPVWSVIAHVESDRSGEYDYSVLTEEEKQLLRDYEDGQYGSTDEELQRLDEIYIKAHKGGQSVGGDTVQSYISYDERDDSYLETLERIYQDSGIDAVAERLQEQI